MKGRLSLVSISYVSKRTGWVGDTDLIVAEAHVVAGAVTDAEVFADLQWHFLERQRYVSVHDLPPVVSPRGRTRSPGGAVGSLRRRRRARNGTEQPSGGQQRSSDRPETTGSKGRSDIHTISIQHPEKYQLAMLSRLQFSLPTSLGYSLVAGQ